MKKSVKMYSLCLILITCMGLFLLPGLSLRAADLDSLTLYDGQEDGERIYDVEGKEYRIYFNDELDYLTKSQEDQLLEQMIPVTDYGNAAFMIGNLSDSDFVQATGDYYHEIFGNGSSGTIFMIDMTHRQLILFSDGDVYKIVTKSYANTITDNVYRMAKKGDYYGCAAEAFKEVVMLLQGNRIRQPMKHITNALLAIIISSLILYLYLRIKASPDKADAKEILTAIGAATVFAGSTATFRNRQKVYNPHESSGGSGGGGGGGGGSSGGGGSHGF